MLGVDNDAVDLCHQLPSSCLNVRDQSMLERDFQPFMDAASIVEEWKCSRVSLLVGEYCEFPAMYQSMIQRQVFRTQKYPFGGASSSLSQSRLLS